MLFAATSPPRLVTLILLTGVSVLSLNMFLPSLTNMAADFQVDYALISLSIAGYLGVTAVLQLIMGPLSDRFGRRPVQLTAVVIFALASAVCAITDDIWTFLIFRVCQGAIISGWVIALAVVRDTRPPQEAASLIGYISMAMAVSPMLGPMLGGLLDASFGWRASFLVYVGLGFALFAICWVDLGETNTNRADTFAKQLKSYPDLLGSQRFWGYALCMGFSVGTFYCFLAGAPLVATQLYGLSTEVLGFAMGSITAGFMFGSFLSGRFASRHALTTMMIAGRLVACGGLTAGLLVILAGAEHVIWLLGAAVFSGIGNGLTTPSASAGALSVRADLAGSASGLTGALTVALGAVLTPITAQLVDRETGAVILLSIMLAAAFTALLAALAVRQSERRAQPA